LVVSVFWLLFSLFFTILDAIPLISPLFQHR
jgi:hypothetical protein